MMRSILLLTLMVFVIGCSNIRPYRTAVANNLVVDSNTESGVEAELDIYHVSKSCQLQYQGTLTLKNGSTDVGLSNGRLHYLVVRFTSSSFWSGRSSSISQETLLRVERGVRYDMDVSYVDAIYNVALSAKDLKRNQSAEVLLTDLNACRAR